MTEDNLGIRDDEFWSVALERARGAARTLTRKKAVGLTLAAPHTVDVAARASLPVVSCYVGTLADFPKLEPARRTILTAVDLATGELRAALAAPPDVRPLDPSMVTAPPPGAKLPDPAKGTGSEVSTIDARTALGIPWAPGAHLLTLILADRRSNRARVELRSGSAAFDDPEVARFLAEERVRLGPPPVSPWPGSVVTSYEAQPDSPAVPGEPGIAVRAPRVSVVRKGGTCILQGAFRLPLQKHHVVPVGRPATPYDVLPGGRRPTAVLPLTLLLTGSAHAQPATLALRVPTFDAIDAASPPASVTGHFAVDLMAAPGTSKRAQTYCVYAFSGELVAGPFLAAFVTEDMLPTRAG